MAPVMLATASDIVIARRQSLAASRDRGTIARSLGAFPAGARAESRTHCAGGTGKLSDLLTILMLLQGE